MYNYQQLHKHSTVYIYTHTYNAQMWLCDPALCRYGGDKELKLSIFVDTALLIKAAAGRRWWEFTSSRRACAALKPDWRDRKFTCNLRPGGTNYCGTAEHRACTKACSKLTLAHSSQDEVPSRLHFISLSGFRFLSKKRKKERGGNMLTMQSQCPLADHLGLSCKLKETRGCHLWAQVTHFYTFVVEKRQHSENFAQL